MSVYLELLHGRKNFNASLKDWGSNGPVLGPLNWVHTTYACTVRFEIPGGDVIDLNMCDGMLFYGGVWYGDWSVYSDDVLSKSEDLASRKKEPEERLTHLPARFPRRPKEKRPAKRAKK